MYPMNNIYQGELDSFRLKTKDSLEFWTIYEEKKNRLEHWKKCCISDISPTAQINILDIDKFQYIHVCMEVEVIMETIQNVVWCKINNFFS